MPIAAKPALKPRKTPVQERSTATVEAILQATIQVLLSAGKEKLTTTQVAARAGVSVGTLYQYFPNKSSLLQACLKHHMGEVRHSIEEVCRQYRGAGLLEMGTALIASYLAAKMRDVKISVALYAVASDIEGAAIAKAVGDRSLNAVAELFATAREGLCKDPELVASVVVAVLNGVSRRLLESKAPERHFAPLRDELVVLVHAYLQTCVASPLMA